MTLKWHNLIFVYHWWRIQAKIGPQNVPPGGAAMKIGQLLGKVMTREYIDCHVELCCVSSALILTRPNMYIVC